MDRQPYLLVVDADGDRRIRVVRAGQREGMEVEVATEQRAALVSMRGRLPDLLWASHAIKGGSLKDFFDLVQAAWPALPRIAQVPGVDVAAHLPLLDDGALDLLRVEDDERLWRAALRRAAGELRARETVRLERGQLLSAQARLSVMPPALEEILRGLADALREAQDKPDISLRKVETVCASALSRFLDGATVVVMAYERATGVLRPRGSSHDTPEHQLAADHGFLLTEDLNDWKRALRKVGDHSELADLIRRTYQARHALLAMIGPENEPYGVAAYLSQNARPLPPDEEDLLRQVTAHVGQIVRVARIFRQVLRRNVTNT